MKYHTDKKFELIDFHDSEIQQIENESNEIRISLSFANLLADHPANSHQQAVCIKPCLLIFHGVDFVESSVFSEKERLFHKHPDPEKPIEKEIMEAKQVEQVNNVSCYLLSGFHRVGWSEWKICSKSFALRWDEFAGDAWFVDWPPK